MKFAMLLSLFLALPLLACPSMEQTDHTDRQGFKVDMPVDPQASGVTHQHSEQVQAPISRNTGSPQAKPADADKKGRLHKS